MGKRGCRYTRFSQARTSLIVPSGKYSTRIPATLRLSLQCDRSAPPTVLLIWGGRSGMVRNWHWTDDLRSKQAVDCSRRVQQTCSKEGVSVGKVVYEIDGHDFATLEEFYGVVSRVLRPGH